MARLQGEGPEAAARACLLQVLISLPFFAVFEDMVVLTYGKDRTSKTLLPQKQKKQAHRSKCRRARAAHTQAWDGEVGSVQNIMLTQVSLGSLRHHVYTHPLRPPSLCVGAGCDQGSLSAVQASGDGVLHDAATVCG